MSVEKAEPNSSPEKKGKEGEGKSYYSSDLAKIREEERETLFELKNRLFGKKEKNTFAVCLKSRGKGRKKTRT